MRGAHAPSGFLRPRGPPLRRNEEYKLIPSCWESRGGCQVLSRQALANEAETQSSQAGGNVCQSAPTSCPTAPPRTQGQGHRSAARSQILSLLGELATETSSASVKLLTNFYLGRNGKTEKKGKNKGKKGNNQNVLRLMIKEDVVHKNDGMFLGPKKAKYCHGQQRE